MGDEWRLVVQDQRQEILIVIKRKLACLVAPGGDDAIRDSKLTHYATQLEMMQWRNASSRLDYTKRIVKALAGASAAASAASAAPSASTSTASASAASAAAAGAASAAPPASTSTASAAPASAAPAAPDSAASAKLGGTDYTLDEMCRLFFRDYLAIDQNVENEECVIMTARELGVHFDLSDSIRDIAIQCWNLLAVPKLLKECSSGETCQGDSAARDGSSASEKRYKLLDNMGGDLDVVLGHFNLNRQDIATKDGIVQYVGQEKRYFWCKFLKRINTDSLAPTQLYLPQFDTIESAVAGRTLVQKLILSNGIEYERLLQKVMAAARSPQNTSVAKIASIICKIVDKDNYRDLKVYFANPNHLGRKRLRMA